MAWNVTGGNGNNIPVCSMPFVIPLTGLRRAFSIIVLQQSQLELKPVKLRIELFGPIHVSAVESCCPWIWHYFLKHIPYDSLRCLLLVFSFSFFLHRYYYLNCFFHHAFLFCPWLPPWSFFHLCPDNHLYFSPVFLSFPFPFYPLHCYCNLSFCPFSFPFHLVSFSFHECHVYLLQPQVHLCYLGFLFFRLLCCYLCVFSFFLQMFLQHLHYYHQIPDHS